MLSVKIMGKKRRYSLRYLFLGIWFLFTISLATWWIYFGFEQIDRLVAVGYAHTNDLIRYQRMLILEGATLVLALFGGASTLAYYMYREIKQGDQLKNFFLAFTHDSKTALAAAQLQAELLSERVTLDSDRTIASRLLADLQRLTVQLENSLYIANLDTPHHYSEKVELSELLERIKGRFANLTINIQGCGAIRGDIRAVESIFVNIFQNATIHGEAKCIQVLIASHSADTVKILVSDDGKGFPGDRRRLGERFFRHYPGSGTGLGLYLVRALARSMQGEASFPEGQNGFCVELRLPKGAA